MKPNLKPCPFCGDKSETYIIELNGLWYAGCDYCTCEIQDLSEENVINAWNTRHDEITLKKVLLLIPELAIKILALAVFACGIFSFIDWLWKNS